MQVSTAETAASAAPASPAPASSAEPASSASTSMDATSDAPELVSGSKLLVEAYAAIWLIVLGLVVVMWRRTRSLESRLEVIDAAIAKAGRPAKPAKSAASKPAPKSDDAAAAD